MPYVHVVLTLPHELLPPAYQKRAQCTRGSFTRPPPRSREVAADPGHLGAEIGVVSIPPHGGQARAVDRRRPAAFRSTWRRRR